MLTAPMTASFAMETSSVTPLLTVLQQVIPAQQKLSVVRILIPVIYQRIAVTATSILVRFVTKAQTMGLQYADVK
jgi:hypothetical protein